MKIYGNLSEGRDGGNDIKHWFAEIKRGVERCDYVVYTLSGQIPDPAPIDNTFALTVCVLVFLVVQHKHHRHTIFRPLLQQYPHPE